MFLGQASQAISFLMASTVLPLSSPQSPPLPRTESSTPAAALMPEKEQNPPLGSTVSKLPADVESQGHKTAKKLKKKAEKHLREKLKHPNHLAKDGGQHGKKLSC
jgi:hypothetical protein